MKIRYKCIEHERVEDAPFVGALIGAIGCRIGCKDCFNAPLKQLPTLFEDVGAVLDAVQSNPFNEGLILGGLEWSEQPEELVALASEALNRGLKVMVYTGLTLEAFLKSVPAIDSLEGTLYLKYGSFNVTALSTDHLDHGVKLASTNQHIATLRDGSFVHGPTSIYHI